MRAIAGVALGVLIFFPGTIVLQWLAQDVLGLWVPMTQADACLVMIVILLAVIVVNGVGHRGAASSARWGDLNGHSPRSLQRLRDLGDSGAISSRRGATTARRSARQRVDVTSVPGRPARRGRFTSDPDPSRAPRRR